MKITLIVIARWNGDAADPFVLGRGEDLSSFGYFQRPSVREMLTFVARTVLRRTYPGQRQTVEQDGENAGAGGGGGRGGRGGREGGRRGVLPVPLLHLLHFPRPVPRSCFFEGAL